MTKTALGTGLGLACCLLPECGPPRSLLAAAAVLSDTPEHSTTHGVMQSGRRRAARISALSGLPGELNNLARDTCSIELRMWSWFSDSTWYRRHLLRNGRIIHQLCAVEL